MELHVLDHAHDVQEHRLVRDREKVVDVGGEEQPPAERVLVGPEPPRQLLVHDDDGALSTRVALLEEPARGEPDAGGLEVARRHVTWLGEMTDSPGFIW